MFTKSKVTLDITFLCEKHLTVYPVYFPRKSSLWNYGTKSTLLGFCLKTLSNVWRSYFKVMSVVFTDRILCACARLKCRSSWGTITTSQRCLQVADRQCLIKNLKSEITIKTWKLEVSSVIYSTAGKLQKEGNNIINHTF